MNDPAQRIPSTPPKSGRARKTYEAMLSAAQEILEENGIEALNSNAIAKKAGVTVPSFYRYFDDKYDLLWVLGERLMNAQNQVQSTAIEKSGNGYEQALALAEQTLRDQLKLTENFVGGHAILVSLRALPNLINVRLESHAHMARENAQRLIEINPNLSMEEAYDRCRFVVEIGYGALEMLLETKESDRDRILRLAAIGINAVFSGK